MSLARHSLPAAGLAILVAAVWSTPPTAKPDDAQHSTGTIQNAGFEGGLDHWSVHVYGSQPKIEFDGAHKREGRVALRITATEPSDTALGQEIMLQAGHWYRLRGWVKTRGLTSGSASVYGTIQIQLSGGKGIIATGANHGGDTDWTEVPVVFSAPPGGRTRISVFFAGFGKGVGTAWFDDLQLEEINLASSPLKLTRDFLNEGTISPMQYGQFMEYLCNLIPGMWAEQLYDGSFEGLSPYKFVFLRERDFREQPWYPSGAVNRADYTHDPTNPVSGKVAQKIAVKDGAPCTVGIAQDGIFVGIGRPCLFSCYMRQEGLTGSVRVRLHHESEVYAACEFQPTAEWRKYSARLVPKGTDDRATLTIDFRGPATLWLDSASLMPEDNVGGWRKDVVDAVKALKPGVIRFGGSALDDRNLGDFEWRDTIGDRDRRPPFRAWGGLQPAGAGLEEIVQFCRHVDAEPLICVRVTQRTPQDAADQVAYFNGAADTPMGRLRARNGHVAPYRVKFWQIGNEQGGADYESRLAAFARAMKQADSTIELFASYPSEAVLRHAGPWLDYVCPHHYEIANLRGTEQNIIDVQALCRHVAPNRRIRIAVTEWNTTAGDAGPRRAKLWTLENALSCARYHNLLHRHCDAVTIANRSNLTNSFCSGIVQTDNHRLFITPTYLAQQLYATLAGTRSLRVDSNVPANAAPDCSATLSADGKFVTLFAVNPSLEDIVRPLDVTAFGRTRLEVRIWTLTDRQNSGEPDVTNSFAEPGRIALVETKLDVSSGRFDYRFPALSLSALQFKAQE